FVSSLLMPWPPPSSTLFPYTTLFRSQEAPLTRRFFYFSFVIAGLDPAIHRFAKMDPRVEPAGDAELTSSPRRPSACPPEPRWPRDRKEHTSELQSPCNLVCRLLLEKK